MRLEDEGAELLDDYVDRIIRRDPNQWRTVLIHSVMEAQRAADSLGWDDVKPDLSSALSKVVQHAVHGTATDG
jgi:hypothetical protein